MICVVFILKIISIFCRELVLLICKVLLRVLMFLMWAMIGEGRIGIFDVRYFDVRYFKEYI